MFINRSKNRSGTISVRVLEKRGRNNVLIRSFGSSTDANEIERMVSEAREFIQRQTGTYYHLFNQPPVPSVDDFVDSISNNQISVVGPEEVFGKLFDYVGYGKIGGLFRPLVLSRLVAPGSKLKTVDYLWRYNGISYDINKVYRYLDKLCDRDPKKGGIKDAIERITFAHILMIFASLNRKNRLINLIFSDYGEHSRHELGSHCVQYGHFVFSFGDFTFKISF